MKSTKTMVLGLFFILVGISLLFGCSGSFSTVNTLMAGWAASYPSNGSYEQQTFVTSTFITGTWIAFFLIAGGLLIGIIGYFRKE